MKLRLRYFKELDNQPVLPVPLLRQILDDLRNSSRSYGNYRLALQGMVSTPPLFSKIKTIDEQDRLSQKFFQKSIEFFEKSTTELSSVLESKFEEIEVTIDLIENELNIFQEVDSLAACIGNIILARDKGYLVKPPLVMKAGTQQEIDNYSSRIMKVLISRLNTMQEDLKQITVNNLSLKQ